MHRVGGSDCSESPLEMRYGDEIITIGKSTENYPTVSLRSIVPINLFQLKAFAVVILFLFSVWIDRRNAPSFITNSMDSPIQIWDGL